MGERDRWFDRMRACYRLEHGLALGALITTAGLVMGAFNRRAFAAPLGGGLADLPVSPSNRDELAVASAAGVWHSIDGGLSWTGLNQFLPNLPLRRIVAVPSGARGVRIALRRPRRVAGRGRLRRGAAGAVGDDGVIGAF